MSPPARRSPLLWVALALALVVPVAAALTFWLTESSAVDDARGAAAEDRAALNAATLQTLAWATVDYREFDTFFDTVKAGSTGEFLQQFEASEPTLRKLVTDNESVQVPTIPNGGAALLERRGTEAQALIVMDANVSNASTDSPQPRQYRLKVTVTKEDGRWLTSKLEIIDAQA